jgi:hypothetical protein
LKEEFIGWKEREFLAANHASMNGKSPTELPDLPVVRIVKVNIFTVHTKTGDAEGGDIPEITTEE